MQGFVVELQAIKFPSLVVKCNETINFHKQLKLSIVHVKTGPAEKIQYEKEFFRV